MGFFDNILGKDGDKKKDSKNNGIPQLKNPFAKPQSFGGTGQSLGGSQPGIVIPVSLSKPGPLGVRVEKRPNTEGTAIVNEIVPGSQAEEAGLKRGDILCFGGSNGQAEMHYDIFLEMARSDERPLQFEVRRITTKVPGNSAAAASSTGRRKSAEADHRRQAVIAAAEAREKAHKNKQKPMKQITKSTLAKQQHDLQQKLEANEALSDEPMSEQAKQAAAAAKQLELQHAQELGYNPYETARATAGQARNATTAVQHGTIQADGAADHLRTTHSTTAAGQQGNIPAVAPPPNALQQAAEMGDTEIPVECQEALATLLSSSSSVNVASTCNIMKKLLVNATTKGQSNEDVEAASKFRKVRLANPKIKAALIDNVQGAGLEVMMAAGFVLQEQEGESVLIFPHGFAGPPWLPVLLTQLESASTPQK